MAKAEALAESIPGAVVLNQFDNLANPAVHYDTTGPEIWQDAEGRVDILVSGIGTGGTISGAGRFLKERNPAVQVVGVEPVESPILNGGQHSPHKIQGIGAGFVPNTLDRGVYDEVLTGFRVSASGWWGLEGGVEPDLFTFGKVVGGGMPLAALGGRADLMDLLAPLGPVYQAGTLSGNPVATAAGIATLRLADAGVYARVDAAAARLAAEVTAALTTAGVPHVLQRAGSLFSVFLGVDSPVHDYASAQRQDTGAFQAFFHAMLDAGVALPPSAYEAWFLSAAHDQKALDRVVSALPGAAAAAGAISSRS